jgi:hypothetical protein
MKAKKGDRSSMILFERGWIKRVTSFVRRISRIQYPALYVLYIIEVLKGLLIIILILIKIY